MYIYIYILILYNANIIISLYYQYTYLILKHCLMFDDFWIWGYHHCFLKMPQKGSAPTLHPTLQALSMMSHYKPALGSGWLRRKPETPLVDPFW